MKSPTFPEALYMYISTFSSFVEIFSYGITPVYEFVFLLHRVTSEPSPVQRPLQLMAPEV